MQRIAPEEEVHVTGDGAVMAYVMGALRTVMEWVTVPVLAVAMCLPHGALVYWLSSSTVSLAQASALVLTSSRSGAILQYVPASFQLFDESDPSFFGLCSHAGCMGVSLHLAVKMMVQQVCASRTML